MTDARVTYDVDADVLYVTIGKPEISTVIDDDDGLLWRVSQATGLPSGVTIIGFQEGGWVKEIDSLESQIRQRFQLGTLDIGKALTAATRDSLRH